MNIIFTDIDGVLQINNPKKWNKKCCKLYSDICNELDLKAVVTSTWRVHYKLRELQEIFYSHGIDVEIVGYTDVLGIERGEEIQLYLNENQYDNYVIIDDNVRDILPYVQNVVAVEKSYIGLTDLSQVNDYKTFLYCNHVLQDSETYMFCITVDDIEFEEINADIV
jgi:hypothetical protein